MELSQTVKINGSGDLGMDSELRKIIGKDCLLVRQCKNGLLEVKCDGISYMIPKRNVDKLPTAE